MQRLNITKKTFHSYNTEILKETKLFTWNKIMNKMFTYKLSHYFNKYKSFSGDNALAITFHMQNEIEIKKN